MALRALVVALGLALSVGTASAATIHGLVYDDTNGDGQPSAGERGVPDAVVALGVTAFTRTDASGQFDLDVTADSGIVWVRVPDGFVPGPVWSHWDKKTAADLDLGLRRRAVDTGALTFVVGADTHLAFSQDYITGADLAMAAEQATALDPQPAFFTILGDLTQGNREAEFGLVDAAVSGLGVPFVPVPGNHDWYDGGTSWFAHYGPDNYSFDVSNVHFVVWNMAMPDADIQTYLGAELSRVDRSMTIVALTHAPPSDAVISVLRRLGVDYILTGHAHTNRVVDHGGLIELNSEPMLMGGLDFTPAGYRVISIADGRLTSVHKTTLDAPQVSIVAPSIGACVSPRGGTLIVAAELDAGTADVTAKVDCSAAVSLRYRGGWSWQAELPQLAAGAHALTVEATSATGARASATASFEVCEPEKLETRDGPFSDWPQLGGGPAHLGTTATELAPPLAPRWTAAAGGHVITASPVIANGTVYVAVSDLADGATGGVVAFDLVNGHELWRTPTAKPVRAGLAFDGGTIVASQLDGVVLGLDAATGSERWRRELSAGISAQAGAILAAPTADHGELIAGSQRALAVLTAAGGVKMWSDDPVPDGMDSQSLASIAIGEGIAVGTFNRALGGVIAWDRASGKRLWSHLDADTVAINASPVISADTIYIASGADEVTALDLAGQPRWRVKLDDEGFDWGNATVGTPALADGILVVPTLYRDLVALDATTGAELWRVAGTPAIVRTTHYRGGHESGFAASPVIAGGIVWAADTAGVISAIDLHAGRVLWQTRLGVPVLAGLAVSGDWLVAASFDGTVHALARTANSRPPVVAAQTCSDAPESSGGGCCNSGTPRSEPATFMLALCAGALLRRRRRRS